MGRVKDLILLVFAIPVTLLIFYMAFVMYVLGDKHENKYRPREDIRTEKKEVVPSQMD